MGDATKNPKRLQAVAQGKIPDTACRESGPLTGRVGNPFMDSQSTGTIRSMSRVVAIARLTLTPPGFPYRLLNFRASCA